MPSPFATWTIDDLRRAILQGVNLELMSINRRMFDGDHWLDGDGWIGPKPDPVEEGFITTMELLKLGFDGKVIDNEDHPYVRQLRGILD